MINQFMKSASPVRNVYEVLLILKGPLLASLREIRDKVSENSENIDGVVLLAETMSQTLEHACDILDHLNKEN